MCPSLAFEPLTPPFPLFSFLVRSRGISWSRRCLSRPGSICPQQQGAWQAF